MKTTWNTEEGTAKETIGIVKYDSCRLVPLCTRYICYGFGTIPRATSVRPDVVNDFVLACIIHVAAKRRLLHPLTEGGGGVQHITNETHLA